jgi:hypothetical protein
LLSRALEACQLLRLCTNIHSKCCIRAIQSLLRSFSSIAGIRFWSQPKSLLCPLRCRLHRGISLAVKRFFTYICLHLH